MSKSASSLKNQQSRRWKPLLTGVGRCVDRDSSYHQIQGFAS